MLLYSWISLRSFLWSSCTDTKTPDTHCLCTSLSSTHTRKMSRTHNWNQLILLTSQYNWEWCSKSFSLSLPLTHSLLLTLSLRNCLSCVPGLSSFIMDDDEQPSPPSTPGPETTSPYPRRRVAETSNVDAHRSASGPVQVVEMYSSADNSDNNNVTVNTAGYDSDVFSPRSSYNNNNSNNLVPLQGARIPNFQ